MTATGAFEYTVGDMVTELAQHYPKAISTICGHAAHTHAEFFRRVSRLADGLAADGVARGDRLLWLGQNCHRLLETLAAASMLGASVCPVNWRLSGKELQFVYSDLTSPRKWCSSKGPTPCPTPRPSPTSFRLTSAPISTTVRVRAATRTC